MVLGNHQRTPQTPRTPHARNTVHAAALVLLAGVAFAQDRAQPQPASQPTNQPANQPASQPSPAAVQPAVAQPIDPNEAAARARAAMQEAERQRQLQQQQQKEAGRGARLAKPDNAARNAAAAAAMGVGQPQAPGQPVQMPGIQGGNAAGMQANNAPQPQEFGGVEGTDDLITLTDFREPVQLTTLVELVASTLQINISIKGDLPGSITFNAPVPVKKSELLDLLDMLLEQQGWTIVQDRFGMYNVMLSQEIRPALATDRATTRIISTPNVRPSSLRPAIEAQLASAGGQGTKQYTYLDELGLIVATDVPRKLAQLEELTTTLLAEFNKTEYSRFELTHISAPVARDRVLQLVGQMSQASPVIQQQPNQGQSPFGGGAQGSLNNIGDRLTVDAQGNALVFRGRAEELAHIREVLAMIDVPNKLVPKQYFAGSSARQIADIARGQGLGEVTTIDTLGAGGGDVNFARPNFPQQGQFGLPGSSSGAFSTGGSVMVVDESRGNIIYYATPAQQERLDTLIKELDTGSERETIEVYKLRNSKAADVAEVINNLLSGTQPLGSSSLLPDSGAARRNININVNRNRPEGGATADTGLALDTTAFVIADEANNQILVKARAGQQGEFARIIQKLDLRRPQVYVQAQIIAVTTDDRTRLAFETQLINANGTSGVLNTNFGLSTFPTTGSQPILNRKTVASGLSGFTAAIIKSDQIPIIMTALKNETDSRVISSPQLLVDDNEEASVVSVDRQPTSSAQTTEGGGQIVSAGASAEAGTSLTVTPQISDGGYLRLQYEIELSSFTGEAQTVGNTVLPPPSQVNTLTSESVTVPSDSTVVVGGLVVDQDTKSVAKIPLLGDIPLFGKLFGDERKGDRQTVLYVFLTPRILRDPGFEDLLLLTKGPQSAAKLPPDFPRLAPRLIDINQLDPLAPEALPAGDDAAPDPSAPPSSPAPRSRAQPPLPTDGRPVSRPVTRLTPTTPVPMPAEPAQPLNPDD